MGVAIVCAIIGTVFTLVGPDKLSDMTKLITDGLMTSIDLDAVAKIGFTLVAFYVCGAVLSMIQQLITVQVTQNVAKNCGKIYPGKLTGFQWHIITRRQPVMYFPA